MSALDAGWWSLTWEPATEKTWAHALVSLTDGLELHVVDRRDDFVVLGNELEGWEPGSLLELRCVLLALAYPEGNDGP